MNLSCYSVPQDMRRRDNDVLLDCMVENRKKRGWIWERNRLF